MDERSQEHEGETVCSGSVLIVEDHPLYCGALIHLLESRLPEVRAVAKPSAEEGLYALNAMPDLKAIVLDIGLPGLSGVDAITAFKNASPGAGIVILSGQDERRDVMTFFRAGAQVFVSKAASTDSLVDVIRRVICKQMVEPEWITSSGNVAFLEKTLPELTVRQMEILSFLFQGLSNKEIALRMNLAEVTVKLHVSAIFRVLGVTNRTQAVLAATRLGLSIRSE